MNDQSSIDPCLDGIRPHACLKHIPLWPDNGPRMMALRTELQTHGQCPPVQMTAKHEIVDADSRERWRAAKMLQLASIPVAIVPEELAVTVCLAVLFHRRHQTKSALAYLAFPMLAIALDEARSFALEMLKKGNVSPSGARRPTAKSREEIAENLGISETTLKEARRVHEIFAHDPGYKAQMEPRLLAEPVGGEHEQHRPVGLGAIIAGFAGKKNEDHPRQVHEQLVLFGQAIKSFCIRAPLAVHEAQARRVIEDQLEKLSETEVENVQRTAALIVSVAKHLGKGAK